MKKKVLVVALLLVLLVTSIFADGPVPRKKKRIKRTVASKVVAYVPKVVKAKSNRLVLIPSCHRTNPQFVLTLYSVSLFGQSMKVDSTGKLLAFQVKDSTWSSNFNSPRDRQIAEEFYKALQPTEVTFVSPVNGRNGIKVSQIQLTRQNWRQADVNKARELVQKYNGSSLGMDYISDCLDLVVLDQQEKNVVAAIKSGQ